MLGIVTIVLICAVTGFAADPLVGTWVLDEARSKISSGLQVKIERRGAALRYSSAGVEFTALLDGDDYPIRGITSHSTVSLRRLGELSIQRTYKRDGKPVSSADMTISSDGRFLTVKIKRLDEEAPSRQWVNTYQKSPGGVGKDPFEVTWERNPVKSLGNSQSTITFSSVEGGGLHFAGDQVEYRALSDGKNHKVGGTIVADAVALDRVDKRTLREVWKEGANTVATVVRVISEDGAMMTAIVTGTTPQGDHFENVYVYKRR